MQILENPDSRNFRSITPFYLMTVPRTEPKILQKKKKNFFFENFPSEFFLFNHNRLFFVLLYFTAGIRAQQKTDLDYFYDGANPG